MQLASRSYIINSSCFQLWDRPSHTIELEQYFKDLYGLFLNKLQKLTAEQRISLSEEKRFKVLLDELLEVKILLHEEGNTDV